MQAFSDCKYKTCEECLKTRLFKWHQCIQWFAIGFSSAALLVSILMLILI